MKNIKISEAFALYREVEVIAGGLSPRTYDTYVNSEKRAVDFFGDIPIVKITSDNIRAYYFYLSGWQQINTIRGELISLRAVLNFCSRKGYKTLDTTEIKIPKRQKIPVDYLEPDEVESFIDIVAEKRRGYASYNRIRNIAIVKLFWASGIRVSELCALNRNSIKNRRFTVVGKSKNPRVCFITEEVEDALDEYLSTRTDNNEALFVTKAEKRMTPHEVRDIFRIACARSEDFERVRPHMLRRSFATNLLNKGVDIRYIAELLGHESLETTRAYTHISNQKLQTIYDATM